MEHSVHNGAYMVDSFKLDGGTQPKAGNHLNVIAWGLTEFMSKDGLAGVQPESTCVNKYGTGPHQSRWHITAHLSSVMSRFSSPTLVRGTVRVPPSPREVESRSRPGCGRKCARGQGG